VTGSAVATAVDGITGAGLESRELVPGGAGRSGARRLTDEDRLGDFLLESTLDHLQRQEVLALLAEHPPEALDVALVELAVSRRGPLGVDEPLAFEEPDLGDGDVGEFLAEQSQDVADRKIAAPAHCRDSPGTFIRRPPPGRRA
jgi:hypothetical protein